MMEERDFRTWDLKGEIFLTATDPARRETQSKKILSENEHLQGLQFKPRGDRGTDNCVSH